MQVIEAIIQGLSKESQTTIVTENFRSTLSAVDNMMETLAEGLTATYNRTPNNYGSFNEDVGTYVFSTRLGEYFNGNPPLNLVDFSMATCRLIAAEMRESFMSTGGYICFLRYEVESVDWLLIAILKTKTNTGIDPASLNLNENISLDLQHLHEAARVNLTDWQASRSPYLSFIKKSSRNDDVTAYFRAALGCTDFVDSKTHTKNALAAIEEYCEHKQYTASERQNIRQRVFSHFEQKRQEQEPVNLSALSSIINDQDVDDFINFVRDNDHQINATFDAHQTTYKRLKRINGKFGNVSIAFDVQDVIEERIDYNETTNELIISNPSPTLIDEIKKIKQNGDPTEPT